MVSQLVAMNLFFLKKRGNNIFRYGMCLPNAVLVVISVAIDIVFDIS